MDGQGRSKDTISDAFKTTDPSLRSLKQNKVPVTEDAWFQGLI